jgi:uncharacterized protein (DUF433 family)
MKEDLLKRITINPNICFGKPTIRNMRYPVEMILDLLSAEVNSGEILKDYPLLDEKDLQACLIFASRLVRNNSVICKVDAEDSYYETLNTLYGVYWLKHKLITHEDIALYEILRYLRVTDNDITLRTLPRMLKIGSSTLRQRLDNLENANLLIIAKKDEQGSPNIYILKEPYRERSSLGKNRPNMQNINNNEAQGVFLEEMIDSLRDQIKQNLARQKRLAEKL